MRRWLIFAVILLGLGGALGYAALFIFRAPGPLPEARSIVIPHGGLTTIGDTLRAAGAVGNVATFKAAAALTAWEGPLHAGEFAFPAAASLETVLAVLRLGHVVEHKITIPEGLTAAEIALLLAAPDLAGDIAVPAEGAVMPQTYLFERGASVGSVVRRAEAAMRAAVAQAWASRAAEVKLASPSEMVILASLVERETHIPAERPLVARVFLNRLAKGMRLQSDPTAAYAASGGLGALHRPLSRADLQQVNPYNTYTVDGLPAGPICSPGVAAIRAVAHPAQSSALYFVADGSGGHVFSDSLGEHNANVRTERAR